MLVHEASRKLLLNLGNPDRVLTIIPTAKQFTYKGVKLVAVPHRIEEVRVLRNMGFDAPTPVQHYYSWPRNPHRVPEPFHAQRETTGFLTVHPRAFVLNDMGTGKTLSTLWAWDYLRSIGHANKLLVVSPLSTLERTWADEIYKHFPHLSVAVMHGTKARRLKMLADNYDVYLINHDGIKVIQEELVRRVALDTIVVDEIASFRNASAQRWKALKKITENRDRVWGLTGTPTPNEPTDAWAQVKLISPERVPRYAGMFRQQVMKQLGPFQWVPKPGATELVAQAMQPSIRFSRDECVDLPPCIHQTLSVDMTAEQKTAYREMLSALAMEYGDQQVLAVNEAVKVSKLLQIACGVVYGPNGAVVLPCAPRISAVQEVIEQAGTKVIVFVPFKAALKNVYNELCANLTGEDRLFEAQARIAGTVGAIAQVSGETSSTQRSAIFKAFQESAYPKVLVAQPDAMSHGLTLTAANTIVWYGPPGSQETYSQANARVSRPGQKHTQFIVHIEGSPAERKSYARLQDKQKMEGLLLELIQEER